MRLSAHDASFLYTETESGPMSAATISILEGLVDFDELYAFYEPRVAQISRLRQRILFVPMNIAHPVWVDDPDFDLRNHLKRYPVPEGTTTEEAIRIGVKLSEPLLDRDRPLWLHYVLENIEGNTVLVQLGHHAFLDGATAVALSTVMTTPEPETPPPPAEEAPWDPPRLPTPEELSRDAMQEQAESATKRLMRPNLPSPDLIARSTQVMMRLGRPVMQAPWNRSLVTSEREARFVTIPLENIQALRKEIGGTINDVVVSIVTEAATRYMKDLNTITTRQNIRLMCPVNVRDPGADPLDMSGNHVSAMFPVLSAEPMTMVDRFNEVREELDGIKSRKEPETLHEMQQIQPTLPPVVMAIAPAPGARLDPTRLAGAVPTMMPASGLQPPLTGTFNFTCTNVPGPTWTQYMAGHKVINHLGTLMLGGNLGMGVVVSSYDGKMNFGIMTNPAVAPDGDLIENHLKDAFRELGGEL